MALRNAEPLAFARPGGETCGTSRTRPIDLVHLARQTLGDRSVEEEVLSLFAQQIVAARDGMAAGTPAERMRLAHQLKGSARGVGAFALADCAAGIEDYPDNSELVARMTDLIDEVRDFIATICR